MPGTSMGGVVWLVSFQGTLPPKKLPSGKGIQVLRIKDNSGIPRMLMASRVFQRPFINSPQIDMVDMCCFKRVCCFSASLFFCVCFIPTCQEQLPDLGAQRSRFIYSNLISIGFH
jgi:hypothetical protein